jgi:hypothetical protein
MTALWLTLLILSFIAARRDWHRLREQIAALDLVGRTIEFNGYARVIVAYDPNTDTATIQGGWNYEINRGGVERRRDHLNFEPDRVHTVCGKKWCEHAFKGDDHICPLYLGCDTCALCGKPMTEHRNKDGQFYPAGIAPGAMFMCPC